MMYKPRSLSTITILVIFIILTGSYIVFQSSYFKNFIGKYTRGVGSIGINPYKEAALQIEETVTNAKDILNLVLDPTSVYSTPEKAKPDQNVIKYRYGVEVTPTINNIVYPCVCQDSSCSKINVLSFPMSFIVYSKFPSDASIKTPDEIFYECYVRTSYDDKQCFNTPFEKTGSFSTDASTNIIDCMEGNKIQQSDSSSCLDDEDKPLFINTGFTVDAQLVVKYETQSKTFYKTLITTEDIVARAISEAKPIYSYLGIDDYTSYDTAYYVGLLDHPKINIDRLNKKVNLGIPLVAVDRVESYDVLLVSLDDIKSISELKKLTIEISPSDYIWVYTINGVCTDGGIVFKNGYFDVEASRSNDKIVIDVLPDQATLNNFGGDKQKLWDYYRNNNDELKFYIPICVKSSVYQKIKDVKYSDVIVIATVDYEYEKEAKATVAIDQCKYIS